MSEAQVVDAEVVTEPEAPGAELAPTASGPAPTTLFRTDDPSEVLSRATEAANALSGAIKEKGLAVKVQGKDHITVEGWQTLGAMLGITAVCVWSRPVEKGWEARVEARTLDGRVVGAAEAECLRAESRWSRADDYAIRSMAQTRATSKALGSVLRFVVTLAGYSGTPAEEMPADHPQAQPEGPPFGPKVSEEQRVQASSDLTYLCGSEARNVWGQVKQAAGGYMPAIVAEALRAVVASSEGIADTSVEREAPSDTEGLPDA